MPSTEAGPAVVNLTMSSQISISPALHRVSPVIGEQISYDVHTHDDGVNATGGIVAMLLGMMGSGKSTMTVQMAQLSSYLDGKIDKTSAKNLGIAAKPETVIWRGLEYDHWNCLLPTNFQRSFPNYPNPKPVRVHIYYEDEIMFTVQGRKKKHYLNFDPGQLMHYNSVKDVYDSLLPGGINVIYEPQKYFLNEKWVERLLAAMITKKGGRKKEDLVNVQAPSAVWWYEYLEALLRLKDRYEFFTVMMDEADEVFPFGASGDLWHMIAWLTKSVVHMRKNNISLIPATQDINLIDHRIYDRVNYYYWLPGSRPKGRISMVHQNLIRTLPKGWAINEESNRRFGRIRFGRIPKQPPVIRAHGISNY